MNLLDSSHLAQRLQLLQQGRAPAASTEKATMQWDATFNEDLVALNNDVFLYIQSVLKPKVTAGPHRISSRPTGSRRRPKPVRVESNEG
jgi:hypothetical protein